MPDDGLTRKGRATRARIVDTAARLMFRRGVGGTSIDEVRQAAAVSGSQVAHYFDDKRDLTRSVVAARGVHVAQFHSRLEPFDSFAAFDAWVDATLLDVDAVYLEGGCVFGSLAAELVESDTEVRSDLADVYDRWIEVFENGLSTMQRRGELTSGADPRHLATSLVTAHQGGALLTFVMNDPEPLRAALHAVVEYVHSFAGNSGSR